MEQENFVIIGRLISTVPEWWRVPWFLLRPSIEDSRSSSVYRPSSRVRRGDRRDACRRSTNIHFVFKIFFLISFRLQIIAGSRNFYEKGTTALAIKSVNFFSSLVSPHLHLGCGIESCCRWEVSPLRPPIHSASTSSEDCWGRPWFANLRFISHCYALDMKQRHTLSTEKTVMFSTIREFCSVSFHFY